jgi:hypothetical protein
LAAATTARGKEKERKEERRNSIVESKSKRVLPSHVGHEGQLDQRSVLLFFRVFQELQRPRYPRPQHLLVYNLKLTRSCKSRDRRRRSCY